ncbi:MAG: hypothetical protein FXF47_02490 [Candidatus Mcinerneyibacterium aminivorans]|jgi:hypothetical protein|uniref:Outer membrane beta-barrel protein n=1 Tax=Candidatus Mcinerneyibacterium aminivorans TaxID=2703815 RepID=A0A5D0MKL4_9BACT|nr:MAG: hypothetical protein FXF47_02490 [Candidatus Mcinerneyibacterium aminivorans]
MKKTFFIFVLFLSIYITIFATWKMEVELSKVYGGYSDIRIPNKEGDLISLTDDLDMESIYSYRLMFSKTLGNKHTLLLTYAPFKIESHGKLPRDIYYNDSLFVKDEMINSVYVFNSYRLTYRYKIYSTEKIDFGLGVTAKIREAFISLDEVNTGTYSKKSNVGFVPIINFNFNYKFSNDFYLNFSGDALVSPYGRAEDIFSGLYYNINKNFQLKAGYRFLEGGSDVEEVYSFSYFHYLLFGFVISI